MGRPQKKGLDFHYTDNYIFSDKKIKIIMAEYGSDGYTLYSYLKCEIFKEGYYLKTDEDFKHVAASDLNMSPEKIGQMINFFCKRSLLDGKLFTTDKVLTSVEIQHIYQQAVKTRAAKKAICVDSRFWLLNEEDTETFIKVRQNADKSEKNYNKSKKNRSKSEIYDIKKSKVKESKEKESKVCREVPARNGSFGITSELYEELTHTYAEMNIDKSIDKLISYLKANPEKQRSVNSTEGYLRMWISNDNEKGMYRKRKSGASYDIELYESTSALDEEWWNDGEI